MSGAMPLVPLYDFVEWTGKILPLPLNFFTSSLHAFCPAICDHTLLSVTHHLTNIYEFAMISVQLSNHQ